MGKLPKKFYLLIFCPSCFWFRRGLVGVTFLGLTAIFSGRFYWEPTLKVGIVAQQDIRVPKTITIEDPEATNTARQKVQQEVLPIYKLDEELSLQSRQYLEKLLLQADQLREKAGPIPYVSTTLLSFATQQRLRSVSDGDWLRWQAQSRQTSPSAAAPLRELHTLYRKSPNDHRAVIARVNRARSSYRQALLELTQSDQSYAGVALNLPVLEWELDKYVARESLEALLSQGIVPGIPPALFRQRLTALPLLPPEPDRREMIVELLSQVATPNLTPDYTAMLLKAHQAAEAVEPQLVTLREGQLLVLAGQKITPKDFAFLDQLGLTQRRPNVLRIGLISGSVATSMLLFAWLLGQSSFFRRTTLRNRDLAVFALTILGASLATVILIQGGYRFFVPLASVGFILGSFYGARLATLATVLLTIPLSFSMPVPFVSYLPVLIGGVVAALVTDRPHSRSFLARTGLLIGVVQAVSFTLLVMASGGGGVPIALTIAAVQFGVGGILASILALGAIPYLEQLSYTLTPIRLAELANLDRPLLRRLVTEAPGTFHHTLFVANLAEEGARALGADTSLVRTGTLYHDIGKTLRPEFFIENQMGQGNPHDRLNDPWQSAQIIKEHVTGGLKLAQRYHLPEILQAFIPEHQGTIVISYFFHQAKTLNACANEADFRYTGPAPQSRETGIVMLADACEAALRSLGTDTSLEMAEEMVMRIFRARWNDGQLSTAGLTWEELQLLAPVFIRVWQERNHGRIKYPDLAKKLDPTGSALPESQTPAISAEKS